jgi:uncharacterized membrane protein YhiD involved in acid resistance
MTFDFTHIDLTWGMVTTPVISGILLFIFARFITRRDKKRDDEQAEVRKKREKAEETRHLERVEKDIRIAELLASIEAKKEADLEEWKEEVNASFCTIKTNTQKIADELTKRVPFSYCDKKVDDFDKRLREVGG